METELEKEEILSELIDKIRCGSRGELICYAKTFIGIGGAIYTPNPIMLYDAVHNPRLFSALMRGVSIPDGVGVAMGLRSLGISTEVLAGVELAYELLLGENLKFAVIGGMPGRAEAAGLRLEAECGGRCVIALDGYGYGEGRIEAALDMTKPEVVLVCLGSPKQEIFIDRLRDKFCGMLFLGLGGSVDIYSGAKRRAPVAIRRLRLEWLYRMVCEPRRIVGIYKIFGFLRLTKRVKKLRKRDKIRHGLFKNGKKRG